MDRGRIAGLDLLRGIAAVVVVYLHAGGRALPGGHLAVDLFFILSGYVLEQRYGRQLGAGMGPVAFLKKRLARLYPTYLIGAGLGGFTLFAAAVRHADGWTLGLASIAGAAVLLLVPLPSTGPIDSAYPANMPTWSLAAEFVVNFGFAAIYRRLGARMLAALIIGLVIGATAAARHLGSLGLEIDLQTMPMQIIRAGAGFLIGVALARYAPTPRAPLALLAAGLFILAVWVDAPARWALDVALAFLVMPMLVWTGTSSLPQALIPTALWAGRLSYPLYIVHAPLLRAARAVLHLPFVGVAPSIAITLAIGAIAVVAIGLTLVMGLRQLFGGQRFSIAG